jgi:predicted enzyme related to lactoylglutathione lyase
MATDGDLRIEIFVEDVERSAAFYGAVLGFERQHESPGYVAMRRGSAAIGIGLARDLPEQHPLKRRGSEQAGVGVEIVIEVNDVDAAYKAAVDASWPVHGPVQTRPWGLRDFRLSDPDGYYIRVTSTE